MPNSGRCCARPEPPPYGYGYASGITLVRIGHRRGTHTSTPRAARFGHLRRPGASVVYASGINLQTARRRTTKVHGLLPDACFMPADSRGRSDRNLYKCGWNLCQWHKFGPPNATKGTQRYAVIYLTSARPIAKFAGDIVTGCITGSVRGYTLATFGSSPDPDRVKTAAGLQLWRFYSRS